jgi:hypothetical protein
MTYHDEIARQLNTAHAAGYTALAAQAESGVLLAEVRADTFSVVVRSFRFQSATLADATTEQLSRIADRLAAKLTYLLEPLRVVEVDGQAGAVQMRSHPPYQKGPEKRYYEVLVERGGNLSLVRYERQPGQARTPIDAHFTIEVFYRLADDFAEAVR